MTRYSNVRTADSPVVHAHARTDRPFTRCAVIYDGALYTEDPVDCMTCLVGDEWDYADMGKDIQARDAWYVSELYTAGRRSR